MTFAEMHKLTRHLTGGKPRSKYGAVKGLLLPKTAKAPSRAASKPPEMTEAALHKSVTDYLAKILRSPVFWTTFPAGGGGRVRGAQLKGLGLKPGVPDILIFFPAQNYSTRVVGIELKTKTGALSADQKETIWLMGLACVHCSVARSIEDVEAILEAEKVPRLRIVTAIKVPRAAA